MSKYEYVYLKSYFFEFSGRVWDFVLADDEDAAGPVSVKMPDGWAMRPTYGSRSTLATVYDKDSIAWRVAKINQTKSGWTATCYKTNPDRHNNPCISLKIVPGHNGEQVPADRYAAHADVNTAKAAMVRSYMMGDVLPICQKGESREDARARTMAAATKVLSPLEGAEARLATLID